MPTPEEIVARRARRRARLRQRRIIAAAILVAALAVVVVFGALAVNRMGDQGSQPPAVAAPPSVTPSTAPENSASTPSASSAAPVVAPSSSPTAAAYRVGGPAPRPKITQDFIDFNAQRRAEMSAYSQAHYGSGDIRLHPKVVVLHYTCGSDYGSAHATFASDTANMGVKPGVVAQFVIDKNGRIYQQIPLQFEGRHTVGLNYVAYGIECVQECSSGDSQAVSEILHRKAQSASLVALVRWLMYRDHISLSNVIGHGMANDSPYFKDLQGWDNDHTDWSKPQIERLRRLVKSST